MATTAIFGQAVYGDSQYGVLLAKGSTSLGFESIGKLRGSTELIGTTNLDFNVRGNVVGLGIRNLKADSTLTFDSTSRLSGKGTFKGSINLTYTVRGLAKGDTELFGSVINSFNTSAKLRGMGSLKNQSIYLEFSPVGILKGKTSLRASTSVVFNPTGVLNSKKIKVKDDQIGISFNLNNSKITALTNLPWYNTIISTNVLPYDDLPQQLLTLYTNTEGSYKPPYKITEREAV